MRVATLTQNLRISSTLNTLQDRIADAQLQVSTGKKSQVYSGFDGEDSRRLITLKEQRTTLERYQSNIKATEIRTEAIDASMVAATDLVQDFRRRLYEQVEGLYDDSAPALTTFATTAIQQLNNFINVQSDIGYLFNGADTNVQPLLDKTTTDGLYAAHTFGAIGPGQPAMSAAGGATDIINFVTNFFASDGNWNNVTTPAPQNLSVRIDDNVDTSYGELGNDDGFEEVLEVMYAFANLNFTAGDDTAYQTLVNWGIGKLEAAFDVINTKVGENGVIQAQMQERVEAHRETVTLLESQILSIEDVEPYDAVSEFQTLQAQLEASFQTTRLIRNLSLSKFL